MIDEFRKLVTFRKIHTITPIPGADRIETAHIDGWQCVVKKGEFKEGDYGVYFEVDSAIPLGDPRFAFLEKTAREWKGKKYAVIKTMRLQKQLSQGLLLPVATFPELTTYGLRNKPVFNFLRENRSYEELSNLRIDFSDKLLVEKYEKEETAEKFASTNNKLHDWLIKNIPRKYRKILFSFINNFYSSPKRNKGINKSTFPVFIKKTDAERIQNCFRQIKETYKGQYWEVTVKMNGSSMTVYYNKGETSVCSRQQKRGLDDGSHFTKTAKELGLVEKLSEYCKTNNRNLAIQGELCGPSIQGNYEKLEGLKFFVFGIWDIDRQAYVGQTERDQLLNSIDSIVLSTPYPKLDRVPYLFDITLDSFNHVEEMLALAEGKGYNIEAREGVVLRTLDGVEIVKIISNSYLLKNER